MSQLPLNMLRAFAHVYECGGVRPAARRLGIAHSAVSRYISDLEALLDVALIDRAANGRGFTFTPEGERLGRETSRSLNRIEQTVQAIRRTRRRNTVVVETTPSIAARWVFPRLGKLAHELGWVELSVNVDQRVTPPGDGGADICLRMGSGPWSGFGGQTLIEDSLVPVASPGYWASLRSRKKLKNAVLLHDGDPSASWSQWREHFGPAELSTDHGPRYTSGDLVLRAAEQGLGVALGRYALARDSIESGLLDAPIKEKMTTPELKIWMLTPHQRAATKDVQQH